ncbi:MAG: SAM-dependent methyltransferase [Bacteroidetes bacterium]|nr:SAM-dependent methyltransferase [Bacteroidota bacterium]
MSNGLLYLLPTTIGETAINKVIPAYVTETINSLTEFIVEDVRTARRYLIKNGYSKPIDDITFHLLHKHTPPEEIPEFLNNISKGISIGILSESGTPCIADPGADIVKIAHKKNINVIPMVGPSSILLSLMASGFNGQNFAFVGYLPIDKSDRNKRIKELEQKVYKQNQTQIFIETPYRNIKLFEALLSNCSNETLLCIACNISQSDEFIKTKSIKDWKKQSPDIKKKNAIFLVYR